MKTLVDLIAGSHQAESLKFESDILKEAAEAVIVEKRVSAVNAVKGLITTFEDNLKRQVLHLRNLRKQEKDHKELVENIDKAFKHFANTGNPLPMFLAIKRKDDALAFCRKIGIDLPKDDDEAWKC